MGGGKCRKIEIRIFITLTLGYPVGDRRVRDATHERLIKKTARRQQQQQQHPAMTPPVSPAKRGGRGRIYCFNYFN